MASASAMDDSESSCSGARSATPTGRSDALLLFLSSADIGALRNRLRAGRTNIKKIMISSKEAKEKRKAVEDALDEHYDAFNSIAEAYIEIVSTMHTINSIKEVVHEEIGRACSRFLKPVKDGGTTTTKQDAPRRVSYADAAGRAADRVCVSWGPSVAIRKTVNLIVELTEEAAGKYASSQETKDAVLKAVDPCKVGLKVSRITKIRNNAIRIEACEADFDKLASISGLREAGLVVRRDAGLNPRVIVHGVPSSLSTEEIRSQLASQDVNGAEAKDIKVVYRYPARQGKPYSSCVVELRPETRKNFISAERVFLGWSACRVADHVRILQCFKCLGFGHLAANCAKAAHCGHCSEEHET